MVATAEPQSPSTTEGSAGRTIGRRVMLGLGTLFLLLALLAGYAQAVVISDSGFADHVTSALDHPEVRSALSVVIVDRLLQRAPPKLRVAEPILQEAVATVIGSELFRSLFRAGLTRTHHALLSERNNKIVLNFSREAAVVLAVLQVRAPKLASNQRLQTASKRLQRVSQSNALLPLIQALHRIRILGILAPLLALVCFALAIALGVDRRRTLRNVGILIAILAFVVWVFLAAGQWLGPYFVSGQLSQALPGIWDALLGDLRRWSLLLILAGLAIVAVAGASSQPPDLEALWLRSRYWLTSPDSRRSRVLILGVAAVVLGALLVFEPTALFRLVLVVAGAVVVYWGVYAALSLLVPDTNRPSGSSDAVSERTVGAGRWGAVAVIVVALAVLWVRNVLVT